MKLTLEQFETKWAENNLSVTDWFDTTYELFKELETLQSRSCDGCKLPRTDLGFCRVIDTYTSDYFCCNRYEAKEQL